MKALDIPIKLVLLLMLAWTVSPVQAQDEEKKVDKVSIQGLRSWQESHILPRLKTKPGEIYNPLNVGDDVRELAKIMRSVAVANEPTSAGLAVNFKVVEFPRFRKLQVIGNKKLTTARIETLAKLKTGDVLDEKTRESFRRALRKEYNIAGLPQAKITLNLIDLEGTETPEADLQVIVEEGTQIRSEDLLFEGDKKFSGLTLRRYMETSGSWLFIKNYYDNDNFEDDLSHLRDFYARHGYFDARVERGVFKEGTKDGQAVVSPVVKINAGERYQFGKATVQGARLFSQAEVLTPFERLEGKPFNGETFGRAMEKLRALYDNHGLLTTEIVPKYNQDGERKVLDMEIAIAEKDRIYVGEIKLQRPEMGDEEETGAFRRWYQGIAPPLQDQAILKNVLQKPGEIYNRQKERETQRRLAKLGVFELETLNIYNEPTADAGVHNLVIQAADAVTGSLSGGVGFGDATGGFLFAQLNERNMHGVADVFNTQMLLGTRQSSAEISYLNRNLGDSNDTLMNRIYYMNQLRPGYKARVAGTSVEWGHPLEKNDWTMYLRQRLEYVRLKGRSGYDPLEDVTRSYPVVATRLRIEQDTRYPLGTRPREGYLQSYGVEAGYAGGGLLKFEASRDQYWPISEKLTYRVAANAGLMPYSADVLPIHERFFMGGDTDLRGFKYRGAGYFDPKDDSVPTGGAGKLLVKNELGFPIYDPVSGLIFADAGLLGESPTEWQGPRASVGTGLRLDLKNVQVELDLALPVLKQDQDITRFFHFSLQSQF